jgi:cytochrome c biogenesis protein CcmG/thiol:disulfide interchange protein DsbE
MKRTITLSMAILVALAAQGVAQDQKPPEKIVVTGAQAPEFKIKTADGKEVELAALTATGPVLVRLTCGCLGCDKELDYFKAINAAYKEKGLTTLAVFKEPQEKVAEYAKQRNIEMLYAVDPKGESWKIFQTKAMPTNVLIAKGGKIVSIAAGCDPSGLLANMISEKAAGLVESESVDVKKKTQEKKGEENKTPPKE